MFSLTYAVRELRRRAGRTVLTAVGLAVGVGLVIGIVGVSQGLDAAQGQVLAPLQSVGTDILVTRVAGAQPDTAAATTTTVPGDSAEQGEGGGGFFEDRRGGSASLLNQEDAAALLNENRNVITDLAALGPAGQPFSRDFFLSGTLLSFPDDAVTQVAALPGVTSAVGGLVQLAQSQTGTVPEIVASIQTGGETITSTTPPAPMTPAEQDAFRQCLASSGVQIGVPPPGADGGGDGGVEGGGGEGGENHVGGGGDDNPAFAACMPQRIRDYQAQVVVPLQTIEQVVNPPSTNIKNQSYTVAGVDATKPEQGLVTPTQLSTGRWIGPKATDEVLLNVAYAAAKSLSVDSTLTINDTDYKVVGLVRPSLAGATADVYFPLPTLQQLAGKESRVTQVLVKAADSASVKQVTAAIQALLPGAEVATTEALAGQVTGSLADARSLANRLGGALAVIVLVAAFALAALLTLSSIAKRVREIGTLRAVGWSKRRVVRQLLGETLGIGLVGGLLGIGVGVIVSLAVRASAPTLSATTSGGTSSTFSGLFGQAATAVQTSNVTLSVPVRPGTLVLGVVFALVGGLLAGLAGGWRAARLSPSVALQNVG